jgi:hypothetical protein
MTTAADSISQKFYSARFMTINLFGLLLAQRKLNRASPGSTEWSRDIKRQCQISNASSLFFWGGIRRQQDLGPGAETYAEVGTLWATPPCQKVSREAG